MPSQTRHLDTFVMALEGSNTSIRHATAEQNYLPAIRFMHHTLLSKQEVEGSQFCDLFQVAITET